jgi:hypothetical protein
VSLEKKGLVVRIPDNQSSVKFLSEFIELESFFEKSVKSMWGFWKGEYLSKKFESLLDPEELTLHTNIICANNGIMRLVEVQDQMCCKLDHTKLAASDSNFVVLELSISGVWLESDTYNVCCSVVSFEFLSERASELNDAAVGLDAQCGQIDG